MAALNDYVVDHVPGNVRGTRSFTGDRGWIAIANSLLRKLEQKGLFFMGRKKEVGVEVDDDYWITPPTNYRKPFRIYYPPKIHYSEKDIGYSHELVNGRIKLYVPFDKDDDPDTFTLSSGSTTVISINDADATADLWKDHLLILTNGTYSGDTIIIGSNAVVGGGVSVCTFLHTQDNIINSTAGYLTDTFLMLKYLAKFTDISAYDGEIPINDAYEEILEPWLCYKALPPGDKRRKTYKQEFLEELQSAEDEQYTPNPDQARPIARSLPGYEDCTEYEGAHNRYVGDD